MTAPTLDLIDQHRTDLETLVELALSDLASAWPSDDDPRAVRSLLETVLPDLANLYGTAAATLGADWYEELRETTGVPDAYRATVAPLPDAERFTSLAGWAVDPLFGAEPDVAAALSKAQGGFQRVVADMDRNTVRLSAAQDRRATGWSRQTTGKSCEFCVMIAGRGTVYSAQTADFSSHDHCDCIAVPVWGGDPKKVQPYVPTQRLRTQAQRDVNNARIREYLRENPA